ncbi:hypothetical protein, partial [Burkholderia ubonensis]|uniref:hypothetical protein n=1 Tax=Burkholderia ubonensis TaxID=101571 RepID=UPI001C434AC1
RGGRTRGRIGITATRQSSGIATTCGMPGRRDTGSTGIREAAAARHPLFRMAMHLLLTISHELTYSFGNAGR